MKSLVAVVAFAAVLLFAFGCGNDGEPGATPAPAATTTPTEGATPEPGVSAAGRIAFTSNRDGNDEIYVMNADGSGQTRLTDNPARDSGRAWSPDGARIAFTSDRDGSEGIYVMNADGSGIARLTENPAGDVGPVWSPDGSRIAFSSFSGPDDADVHVMERRRLRPDQPHQ